MKLTKTWLSYILWGLFSVILFTDIGIAAVEIYQKTEVQIGWLQIATMYLYAILGILLVIGVYKLIEKYFLPKLNGEMPVLEGAAEVFSLVIVLIIAVAVRLITVMSATGGLEGTTQFYDYAVTVIGNRSLDVHNNGAYLYGNILSFFLGFLGYKESSAMAVQAGIQLITLVLAYFTVKKGLGRLNAWLCLLMMSFLPGSFMAIKECTPDSLFTLFFVLYLLILICVCEANRAGKIKDKKHALLYLLLGIMAAFMAYYDTIGIVTVIIGVVAIVKIKNDDVWANVQKTWFQLLMFLLSFALGFVLFMWFLPLNGCEVGPAAFIQYGMDFIPSFELNLMLLSPHKGQWDSLALFIMSGLWFVGFLRDNKDNAFPFVIMIDVTTVLVFLGIVNSDYTFLSSFTWIMLSALGVSSLRRFRKNEKDIAAAEKAKRDTEARKVARERRRSAASGEKEIRLDNVNTQPKREVSYADKTAMTIGGATVIPKETISHIGYGIGKKAEQEAKEAAKKDNTAVSFAETKKTETNEKKEDNSIDKNVSKETSAPEIKKPEMVVVKEEAGMKAEAKVSLVESKPEVKAPVPTPVESKPAYSYGSPSRRPIRMPSKSTFSPEELERIRQYTGMNIPTPSQQTLNNHVRREEKVLTPGETVPETNKMQTTPLVQPIAQTQPSEESKTPEATTVTKTQPTAIPTVDRQPKLIRNPLPGPKPHVSRELNYDYMPKTSEMKYDIEDLKGRDYFDI